MTDSSPHPPADQQARSSLAQFIRYRWTLLLPIVLAGIAAAIIAANLAVLVN